MFGEALGVKCDTVILLGAIISYCIKSQSEEWNDIPNFKIPISAYFFSFSHSGHLYSNIPPNFELSRIIALRAYDR